MPYEVVVKGLAARTIPAALDDLDIEVVQTIDGGSLMLRARDQAALVGVISHLHSLNVTIVHVRYVFPPPRGSSGTFTRSG